MKIAAPVSSVTELLASYGLDPEKYEVVDAKMSTWDQGDIQKHSISANVKRKYDLALKPASGPTAIFCNPPVAQDDYETAFFFPDMQIGYRWSDDMSYLDPFHDRSAIDVAIQMCANLQPDHIVILGDFLDFPTLSLKYRHKDMHAYRSTIQAAIEEGYYILSKIARCVPTAYLHFLMGNHEARLANYVSAFSSELASVRKAQEELPVLSLPNLLRLKEMHYKYNNEYDELVWLWPNLVIRHGEDYGASMGARDLAVNTVQGHAHKIVLSQRTIPGPRRVEEVTLMSPGCLCRIDGSVPSKSKQVDWHQGVGVATLDHTTGDVHMYPIPIHRGTAFHRGIKFKSAPRDILEETTANATGVVQFRR